MCYLWMEGSREGEGGQACEERVGSKKEKKKGRERDLSMYLRQSEKRG